MMHLTFRWFDDSDPIPLEYIKQIPGMKGVVSALYDLTPLEAWPVSRLKTMRHKIEAAGLDFRVVESIPVSDEIKLCGPRRDEAIYTWIKSMKAVAEVLGPRSKSGSDSQIVVTYNFMPIFDWTRSNLAKILPDLSTTLSYDASTIEQMEPIDGDIALPGWLNKYTKHELVPLLEKCRSMDSSELFSNLEFFLKAVVPVAEKLGIKLAIHPDDPPWPIFGIPRIITNAEAIRKLLNTAPSPANGLCFCTGSLGVDPDNNIEAMAKEFASNINFVHLRNISIDGYKSFSETAHYSKAGHLNMAAIIKALFEGSYKGPIRPDHGRMIWGENGRPGYGLYDRALGSTYILGLIEACSQS